MQEASGSGDSRRSGDAQDQFEQRGEQKDDGHSGEGAASALAHMKSQTKQQHRHQTGEADDAAGSSGGHSQ